MADAQENLQYKDHSGIWHLWPNMKCDSHVYNFSTGYWEFDEKSASSYDINHAGSSCF